VPVARCWWDEFVNLPLTGERTVPGIPHENYWFRRHEVAYQWLASAVAGRLVLDVGCGEGYGTALLAASARRVVGLDYDTATVAHAARHYRGPAFVRANLAALPIAAGAVEAVAALQVIEHVWDHPGFLAECRRVLAPAGMLMVTTPNRLTFSPGLDRPVNPFHSVEFTAAELVELGTGHGFTVEDVAGVHAGPRLAALDRRYGSFVAAQLAAPPDAWPDRLRHDVASVTASDFVLADARNLDVDAALDLVVRFRRP
jgi:SAM-dependent methyltransferase